MPSGRGFRDNVFLVAAAALPLVVVAFFLLSTMIPRWLVDPPAHDLLFRTGGTYDQAAARVSVTFRVTDGRVDAVVQPLAETVYPVRTPLYLLDHVTGAVREIPFSVPTDLTPADGTRVVAIDALNGVRVSPDPTSPDGYVLRTDTRSGPGLVGEIFGMGRYRMSASLVKDGRSVAIDVPEMNQQPVVVVGWVLAGVPGGS
jgi:hypothetical protein